MKIALAQINSWAGNIPFNEEKIKQCIKKAHHQKAQLLIFPEMALNGYPSLDFFHRPFFLQDTKKALKNIHTQVPQGMAVLVGALGHKKNYIVRNYPPFNSVFLLQKNKPAKMFSKEYLADYNVFDETRYFSKGNVKDNFFFIRAYSTTGEGLATQDKRLQILICEEIWQNPDILFPLKQKPDLILSLNASPFDLSKWGNRLKTAQKWVKQHQCSLVYVNMVGGQEELIFDGGSFILNKEGQIIHQSLLFEESLHVLDLNQTGSGQVLPFEKGATFKDSSSYTEDIKHEKSNKISINQNLIPKTAHQKGLSEPMKTAWALIFGLREFAQKNGFEGAHLGLSGGIDSAVTACLACEALGPKKVQLFFLPGPWTSALSKKGAYKMAQQLNCPLLVQSIKELYTVSLSPISSCAFGTKNTPDFMSHLSQKAKGGQNKKNLFTNITTQNIQARLRSLFLMAYANQNPKSLLLGTANKSELAMGYGTLYGDLTGGLLPIGDLFKTEVFALARWLKVPSFIIRRPPSAELTKNQKDVDDLPPYSKLDPVLKKLIEQTKDPKTAFEQKIFQSLIKSQFKRKQSPPILKVKSHSFDRGWRWPFYCL